METESSSIPGLYQNNQYFAYLRDYEFEKQSISNLSLDDQILFQKYGSGNRLEMLFTNTLDAFEYWLRLMPNAIAAEHEGVKISYKQLDDSATILALILKQKDVKSGDKVGLYISRSIPMLVGIIAILKLGATYVPQDVRIVPENMLQEISDICNFKVILSLSVYRDKMNSIIKNESCIFIDSEIENPIYKNLFGSIKLIRPKDNVENNVCFVLFTSGTTGTPNGVEVTHKNLCNILYNPSGNLGIHPGIKVAQILNISFDMSAWEILGCLGNGGTLLIRGKDINETVKNANVIIATPSILTTINPENCKDVKSVAVAGEPCPLILANTWSKICDFYNCCGPTETTIVNTMQKCHPNSKELSIGKPTPNNTVYILDKNNKPCKIGDIGIMWAGGYCVTKGYINNQDLTNKRYAHDPFINNGSRMFNTGDLGKWNENGELLHFGRVDDQVKIKGFRVELDAISKIIETLPQVKRAVTIKHKSELFSLYEKYTNSEVDLFEIIKKTIEDNLPYYYLPNNIICLKELPRTSRGKIDKRKLLDFIIS